MALANYKDLCIDAADPHALAAFWAPLLGLDLRRHGDGDADLRDGDGRVQVWINRVPEPKTVKNRLHLDINAASLEPAVAGGATVLGPVDGWTVLTDPDGQEFCIFVRDEPVTQPLYELVWDCAPGGAGAIAGWWAELLGGRVDGDAEESYVEGLANCPFDYFVFGSVPESKTVKNRLHVDVTTSDVEAVVAAGATLLRPRGDAGLGWHVLADPSATSSARSTRRFDPFRPASAAGEKSRDASRPHGTHLAALAALALPPVGRRFAALPSPHPENANRAGTSRTRH